MMSGRLSMDEIRKIFDKFDRNGDGKICRDELSQIISALGPAPTPDEITRIMSEMDRDGDGNVDFDEFLAFHTSSGDTDGGQKELRDAFDMYDLDKNGLISASELHEVLKRLGEKCSLSDCRKMIRQVDKDGDGNVNFEEFKKMMTHG